MKTNRKHTTTGEAKPQSASPRGRDAKKTKKRWVTQLFREGSSTGPVVVEYTFPTQDGGVASLRIPLSELRHPRRLLDQFCNHMPLFPESVGDSDKSQLDFLKRQMSRHRASVEIIPKSTWLYRQRIICDLD